MSFISSNTDSTVYAPGYFLAHEECRRETWRLSAPENAGGVTGSWFYDPNDNSKFTENDVATRADGTKYVPMGSPYYLRVNEGEEIVSTLLGLVYEDVDVTTGDMPGSIVTKGTIYYNRLPEHKPSVQQLTDAGFTVVIESALEPVRPGWTNS